MKVLVTGADGFIGSHLTEELVKKGYEVRAFTYYNSFGTWGWLDMMPAEILKSVEIFSGDIRDYDTSKVLITSTSEVYGTAQYVPIDEKHPYQGQSPYSATKIGADRLAESFYRSFETPISIVRPFNTYGPRQSARAVIPTIISQLLAGKKEIKLGALSPTRDFNYVKDTVAGFISIAESDRTIGEEINIATQNEISIGELASEIISQINPDARIICEEERLRPEKSEVNRLLGSNEKIKRLTGWRPQYSLKEGLQKTIDWVKENNAIYKTDIYNI